jgi:tetratricopeptide (TPR) repeat protein
MNISLSSARSLLIAFCMIAPAALMAQGYEPDTGYTAPESGGMARRTPGFFARLFNSPARTNATEQLAYAKDLQEKGHTRRALKAFRSTFLFFPTSIEAPEALLAYAALLQKRGKYSESFDEYQYLVNSYAGRFPYDTVIDSQYALANQVRTERYGRWFFGIGFVTPDRAIPYYFQVASNAPNWKLAPEALISAAAIYQQNKQFDEAIAVYSDLQTRYPGTDEAKESAFQMVQCLMEIAKRQPNNTQHTADTRAALALYLRDHPESPHRDTLKADLDTLDNRQARTLLDRASVYERAQKKEVALNLYRELLAEFPASPLAEEARLKIKSLTPPSPTPKE